MNRLKKTVPMILSVIIAALIFVEPAHSEQDQGKLKSLAKVAKVFTMESEPGKVLFINYNSTTQWKNLISPDELDTDDFLTVVFSRNGSQLLATSVTKAIPTPSPGIRSISTRELADTLDQLDKDPPFSLIDTRALDLYDAAHIPGAVSVPLSRIIKRTSGLLPESRSARLIFYDQGAGGTEASKSAELARNLGYSNITIYSEGISGWLKSGRFASSSTAFIRKKRPLIVDLRGEEQVAAGHLEGALNFPAARLKEMFGHFPMDRRGAIVLYGESDQQAIAAARVIKGWGYRNITIFKGGTGAWLESAEVLSIEPVEQDRHLSGTTFTGQLKGRDFEMAMISPAMVEIVDVRSHDEYKGGKLPVGKHIPLQELSLRHGELSKEKIQVVFGTDEQQAEMAYDLLKQLGYRLNYLQGKIEFRKDGSYQIK